MEIKFRIYGEAHKEFRYWGFIEDGCFTGPPTGRFSIQECRDRSEQFTGKLDKNGKEIYVGDMLELNKKDGLVYVYSPEVLNWDSTDLLTFIGEKHFDNNGIVDETNYQFLISGFNEVIGNVHQNSLQMIMPRSCTV